MKRTTWPTRQQLALVLDAARQMEWPPQTQATLITALADLLLEAHRAEVAGSMTQEVRDERQDHS